ncbi:MAG TPA: 50S ribosomal protein L11 methyltransferase [Allosphingosinicella sp.]|jgi:type II protein arginine methyltransferase|nr:50S ribosomal protein L11 methyltransferase [Allosphingosinicella sp.]
MSGADADRSIEAAARLAFERLVESALGDARKLAALANLALANGPAERAYALAKQARALAPGDPDVRSRTELAFAHGVPRWHFGIVRDSRRNAAYDRALRRSVTESTRVLDIGAGTGLLALMAGRAGAASVTSCESSPAVADAASEIVALNGLGDRVRIVPKRSTEFDAEADMGGRADLIVSEIVSSDMLGQKVLEVMEDAVARLLAPGGRVIPARGQVRVALAFWEGLDRRRLGEVEGFDLSPFNRLEASPLPLKPGDPGLGLRSAAADLFDFDFASGGPFRPGASALTLAASGGPVNGIAQWIRLELDEATDYENAPAPGAASCWNLLFHTLEAAIEPAAGEAIRVRGAHGPDSLRVWLERGPPGPDR